MGRPRKIQTADAVQGEESVVVEENVNEQRPSMDSAEWTDYCIGLLRNQHVDKDRNPNQHGLRYLVETLLGPIVRSVSTTIQGASETNGYVSTADHEITIRWNNNPEDLRTFGSSADCSPENCDATYSRFPAAMSSTRAMVRAMRQALRLTGIAAEEISEEPLNNSRFEKEISSEQISALGVLCKRLNVNVVNYLNSGEFAYKSIKHVTQSTATNMIKKLNKWQQDENLIERELGEYDPDWKKKFS
jgi:hypothetical protein